MTFSKEQWKGIERTINDYGVVKIKCDGHEIIAKLERLKMRLVVGVYVDGEIKAEWFNGEHTIYSKYFFQKKYYILRGKQRTEARKILNDKRLDKLQRIHLKEILGQYQAFSFPHFPSAKAFCRRIQETCTEIELME